MGMSECDYDVNPTYLYQAIEAKQWDHVRTLFTNPQKALEQAATWVIRKETNGKLRWRLLPLHAAVIFACPLEIVELLIQVYPSGAQFKDDQGMLPLHLAFRNETEWEVIEELLTAYPQAIGTKDRKGRTPLQCATSSGKKKANVLELYTQIAVSGERQKAVAESRTVLDSRISAMQETHVQTLNKLKVEFEEQLGEMSNALEKKTTALAESQLKVQDMSRDLGEKSASEVELTMKLNQVSQALNQMNLTRKAADSLERSKWEKRESSLMEANEELLAMVQTLSDQQTALKIQLDKQAWESKDRLEKNDDLWNKLQSLHQDQYCSEKKERDMWRTMLQSTNDDVSQQLGPIMEKCKLGPAPPVREITTIPMVDMTPSGLPDPSVASSEEKKD